jgi:LPS-assembly lipoprotein
MIQKSEIRNRKSETRRRKPFLISDFRFLISVVSALALTGCGFHPLYGTIDGKPGIDMSSIYVKPIPERTGYVLRNDLLDLFDSMGNPEGAKYRLEIELKTQRVALGFLENAQITRYNFYLTARYQLISTATNKAVKRGTARTITSYNVVSSPYATVTAEKDAQDRAARDIAETVRTELAVFLRQAALNPNAPPPVSEPAEPAPPLDAEPTTAP